MVKKERVKLPKPQVRMSTPPDKEIAWEDMRRRFNRDRVINYVQGFLLGFSVGALVMALVSGAL